MDSPPDTSVPGLATAGWFLARELAKALVEAGVLPTARVVSLIDGILYTLETHDQIPEPGRTTNAKAREHLEGLSRFLAPATRRPPG